MDFIVLNTFKLFHGMRDPYQLYPLQMFQAVENAVVILNDHKNWFSTFMDDITVIFFLILEIVMS